MKWIAAVLVVFAFSCSEAKDKREAAQKRAKFEMGCPEAEVKSLGKKAFGLSGCGKRWVWEYYQHCEGKRWRPATKKPHKIEKAY